MAVARAWDADTDPAADTALSPWIWVPLIFLVFACLLFVSFRRAKAFELVDRFTTACVLSSQRTPDCMLNRMHAQV